jgi:hypothetical protein
VTHRGSGRGPNAIEHAAHLSAEDLARAVARRRDRLVARQRVPYQADPRRADEIETLGDVHRLLVAFEIRRLTPTGASAIPSTCAQTKTPGCEGVQPGVS